MKTLHILLILCFTVQLSFAQVILNANEPGNTYEDINAVLAPGHDVVEVPDCSHSSFGRHIDEVFDKELNTYVFRFIAHKTPDNDRCKKFDRQRIEIKTYGKSPENTKGLEGETVEYKWKFKLPRNFKVSKNFTHLHQIKSVGSVYSSRPIISLTARKGTPDRLELRYAPEHDQSTIGTIELDLLKGHWVEVTEVIHYSNQGSYSIEIKKVSNGSNVFEYSNDSIDMWQDGSDFMRPKWGIYRSLKRPEDIKDEMVLFNSFSIDEIPILTLEYLESKADKKQLVPDSKKRTVNFKSSRADDYDSIELYDGTGKKVSTKKILKKYKLDLSALSAGNYYLVFTKNKRTVKILKCST
ncbi:heparin lyase I family protein [uncultured Winogradskyella sp.]|uniref:heparin lyase I family protein n=1 Tax=uncultured Winogradskyella sp. TaxID=395353 RepID=UPI0026246EB1|nr:heparin lyase I family protein [uncultured Winogradskyella sp.]